MTPPTRTGVRVPRAVLALTEHLVACLVACRIHETAHPRVTAALSQARDSLHELRAESGEQAFSLLVHGETLVFQGRVPIPHNISAARLVEALRRWRAAGLQIHADVPDAELSTLFRILLRTPDQVVADASAVNRALAELGAMAVRLVPATPDEPAAAKTPEPVTRTAPVQAAAVQAAAVQATAGARPTAATVPDSVEGLFTAVASGHGIELGRMRRAVESLLTSIDAATTGAETIDLGQQPQQDPLLVSHSVRCAGLAMLATRGLTRDPEVVLRVGTAALVHDIGKLRLPLHLIHLEGDNAENGDETIRRHAAIGADLLLHQDGVDQLCVDVAFGHHRTPSGGGHPETPHDHRPSRFVQLVRICDLFESFTARRGNRPAATPSLAWRMLAAASDEVDGAMLRRVIESVGIWPVGTTIQLGSGEIGRVVRSTREPAAPIVRVLTKGSSGSPPGSLLDLSRHRGSAIQIIGLATSP